MTGFILQLKGDGLTVIVLPGMLRPLEVMLAGYERQITFNTLEREVHKLMLHLSYLTSIYPLFTSNIYVKHLKKNNRIRFTTSFYKIQ